MTTPENRFTVPPLREINRCFNEQMSKERREKDASNKRGSSFFKVTSDVLFYIAIAVIFYTVLCAETSSGNVRSIMGYSYFTVMSSSMRDEIPKGSLIITQKCDAAQLKVGDNITYYKGNGTTVTHKIVEIIQGGEGNGRRYQTKGVNNASPDNYTVAQADVIGKVVFVLPAAGTVINYAGENVHIILIFFLICSLISFLLRGISGKETRKGKE